MGIRMQTVAGRVVNPGAVVTAVTVDTGDSFVIPNFNSAAGAWLVNAWAHEGTPGVLRLRSPKLHDNAQGLRLTNPSSSPRALLPLRSQQPIYSQDTITVELSGGGAETDVACLQFYYPDDPGASQRMSTWAQVKPRVLAMLTCEVDVLGAATVGDWSAGTAMTASFPQLKANSDYAVLGYTTSAAVAAIALAGSDTSNFKVGGPGPLEPLQTVNWFVELSDELGLPTIPIINSANAAATNVYQVSASASVTTNVALILAYLGATQG